MTLTVIVTNILFSSRPTTKITLSIAASVELLSRINETIFLHLFLMSIFMSLNILLDMFEQHTSG